VIPGSVGLPMPLCAELSEVRSLHERRSILLAGSEVLLRRRIHRATKTAHKLRPKTFGGRKRRLVLLAALTAPILAVSGCGHFWDLIPGGTGTTATTTTLTASTTAPSAGASVTLTATVSPSAATGTVTFYNGSTSLGTGTLNSGTATLSQTFAAGTYSVTATYGGNSTYASSTSSAVSIVSTTASSSVRYTTITVNASSITLTAGESVTLTATLSDADATGKVRFYDASTSPVSLLGTATLDSGTATLPVTFATVGTHQIMASYTGSSGYAVSTTEDALLIIIDK
jgi:hypothetical protein